MKTIVFSIIFTMLFSAFSVCASGQKFSEDELQELLRKAGEKTAEYSLKFKGLSAKENKLFETFDDGKLKSRRTILSDFIVYESPNRDGNLAEFRNVREVDGKIIKDSEKRTTELFAKLEDAKSFADELKKLNKESLRYDEELIFSGTTLFQTIPLGTAIIESFKFEEINREIVEGRESAAIKFQQTAVNPNINLKVGAPEYLQVSNTFYRGAVWLDLKNYRILKLILELTIESPRLSEPFVVLKQEFDYQPGRFEIYLPQKIVIENSIPQIGKSLKLLMKNSRVKADSEIQNRLTAEYRDFSQFDVTVKSN